MFNVFDFLNFHNVYILAICIGVYFMMFHILTVICYVICTFSVFLVPNTWLCFSKLGTFVNIFVLLFAILIKRVDELSSYMNISLQRSQPIFIIYLLQFFYWNISYILLQFAAWGLGFFIILCTLWLVHIFAISAYFWVVDRK